MTLRTKSIIFSLLAIGILIISAGAFSVYKSMNEKLIEVITILDKINHSSYEIQREALSGGSGEALQKKVREITHSMPEYSNELKRTLLSDEDIPELIQMDLSFVRINNAINVSLPGQGVEKPLKEQLYNETEKIEKSVEVLLRLSEGKINKLKGRAEVFLIVMYLVLIAGICAGFFSFTLLFISPLMALSRSVEDVKKGLTENIAPVKKNDEIGRLSEFTRLAISDIKSKTNELEVSKKEMELHYQRQIAFSNILKLATETETMEELIGDTLKIILSFDWMKIEAKGGLFLVEDEPSVLVLKSAINFNPEITKACARVPFGRCICGRAAESRQFVHVDCINEMHDIVYEGMKPHGHYCVPILFGRELLGVIVLYLADGKRADQDEIDFLTSVARILADVIARRRLEEKQKLITTAIDQAGEGIIITDRDANIQYANPSFAIMTGYNIEELIYSNTKMLNSGQQSSEFYKEMWATILSGENWEGTLINKKKDGSFYNEKMIITSIKNTGNEITHFVAIKRDITREKRLEEQLLHSQKMEAVGTLAGGIAHDFNNVLTAIMGYAEILKDEIGEDDPKYKAISIIDSSAQRGADMASRILNVTRKDNWEFRIADLNKVTEETIALLSRSIPKNITIDMKLKEGLPKIKADTTQLQQVIMNLAVNARDAMPEGGRLLIETEEVEYVTGKAAVPAEKMVRFSISDTGKGIEKQYTQKVFDPFFTTKNRSGGTGLGLYIVHSIVSNHNGYINLYSEPGYGTRFNIYFPVCREVQQKDDNPGIIEEKGSGRILLVEDEFYVRECSRDLLEHMGYSVLTAPDGSEAIKTYSKEGNAIDLVLLDMIMPGINGVEVFHALKSINPGVRIVIISGYSDEGFSGIGNLLKNGARGFVQKPFTREVLSKTISAALKA
ncbi:MAG: ATP-binding protein [Nitrospirota bacterium]|nr:ATP-binding protein [Nitrospirota bacterium]